jgi:ribose transport system permease protein
MSKIFSLRIGSSTFSLSTPVLLLLILAAILSFILNNTRFGRYLCAVGSNSRVAQYSAIQVDRVRFWAYVVIGLMVGISAALLAARFNTVSTPNFGLGFELDAIAAVIIGGTAMSGGRGSVWGTVVGILILQIIQNMLNMAGLSPYFQGVVKGIVIIASVYIQKQRQ